MSKVRFDPLIAIAIAALLVGWFWMNTFVTSVGRVELSFRFYDLWDLIRRPTLLFTGAGNRHSPQSILFGSLCATVAFAPLIPYIRRSGNAWPLSFAPLALMLLSGALLYFRMAPDYFSASGDVGDVGRDLLQLANELAGKVVGAAARHVSIGLGAYLSFAASIAIAVRGWQARRS